MLISVEYFIQEKSNGVSICSQLPIKMSVRGKETLIPDVGPHAATLRDAPLASSTSHNTFSLENWIMVSPCHSTEK
jgi:hypothetical protein